MTLRENKIKKKSMYNTFVGCVLENCAAIVGVFIGPIEFGGPAIVLTNI